MEETIANTSNLDSSIRQHMSVSQKRNQKTYLKDKKRNELYSSTMEENLFLKKQLEDAKIVNSDLNHQIITVLNDNRMSMIEEGNHTGSSSGSSKDYEERIKVLVNKRED